MTPAAGTSQTQPIVARLRLLATSDVHMDIQGFDYVKDVACSTGGLARLAPVIERARTEAHQTGATCLLLDNGDTLQGNAMGDLLAHTPSTPHPIVNTFNTLRYDAVGLGNHDFDHGLAYLDAAIRSFEMPVLSSNVHCPALPGLLSDVVLTRSLSCTDGTNRDLHIGLVSVLPPQTAAWNQNHLRGKAEVSDALEAAKTTVAKLKAAGADIIVALAHMGIASGARSHDQQNAALAIAKIEGVDAVIAGHTHVRFPDSHHPDIAEADAKAGTLAGVPAALPGVSGSDLAVIDLELYFSDTSNWHVHEHQVALHSPGGDAPQDDRIIALAAPMHTATRAHLAQPVGTLDREMHSYFALVDPSPVPALVAMAKRRVIERLAADTEFAHLPLLASASSPATGGLSGPSNFVTLPKGEVQRRHIAGLNPFANQIWGVRLTGAEVLSWLERSARLFHTLQKDDPDQPLTNPAIPGFLFDGLYGLTYKFDPRSGPRYDLGGALIDAACQRVFDVRWQGRVIETDQEFLVATTHFRSGGGGGFAPIHSDAVAIKSETMLGTALTDHLKNPGPESGDQSHPWGFASDLGVSAILNTSPDALNHLTEIAHLNPEPCGLSPEGFARVRLHL